MENHRGTMENHRETMRKPMRKWWFFMGFMMGFTLCETKVAIENCHLRLVYPLKVVIFQSHVNG